MARLVLLLFVIISLCACTQNKVKNIQATLQTQIDADTYYAQGDCAKALPLYLSLASSMPSDSQSLLRAGNCYAKNEQFPLAEQSYQQALVRNPDFVKAWYNLSYLRAQLLANTVSSMYKNVGSTTESEKIRALTLKVLEPFNIELEEENSVD